MRTISSIAGIVLSIVAIVFSILVDRRSSKVSDQTIQSLQKIESTVEHLSSDTRELIKAGWDKMLGSVDRAPSNAAEVSAKQIAEGIVAELRSELAGLKAEKAAVLQRPLTIERALSSVETSLEAQLKNQRRTTGRPSEALNRMVAAVTELSPTAREIAAESLKHTSKEPVSSSGGWAYGRRPSRVASGGSHRSSPAQGARWRASSMLLVPVWPGTRDSQRPSVC